jgi:hypothetical protein
MILGFFFTSCGGGKSGLVGRWYKIEGSGSSIPREIELLKDGTGFALQQAITWKTENKRFYVTHPGLAMTFDYELSGSKLELSNDDGQKFVYVKNLGGEPALVGTWELYTRDGESVEGNGYVTISIYNKDGSGAEEVYYEGEIMREVKGNWIAEKDLLYKSFEGKDFYKLPFTIKGETLTVTATDGTRLEYKKK